jgi:hypothetical protein
MYGYDEVTEDFESVEGYTLEQGFIDEMSKDVLLSNAPIGTMGLVSHVCNLGGIAYCSTHGFMIGVGFPVFGEIYGAACSVIFYFGCP